MKSVQSVSTTDFCLFISPLEIYPLKIGFICCGCFDRCEGFVNEVVGGAAEIQHSRDERDSER